MNINQLIKDLEKDIKETNTRSIQIEQTKRLASIMSIYNGDDENIPFSEVAKNIKINENELKMMTGFGKLDSILKGLREQQIVVMSGFTKHGKTSFAMEMTRNMENYKPLWFPLEQSASELISIMIERNIPVPNLAVTPKTIRTITIDWVEKKIIEAKVKYDTKIIFIDHIDFLIPFSTDNHALRLAQTMRDLKDMAKRLNVCIVILCHLVKTKMDTNPTLEDIRGSSSIAQEADTVIFVWRETKKEGKETIITNNTNISILANRRHGTTGNIKMVYEKDRYLEKEWVDFADYEDKKLRELL